MFCDLVGSTRLSEHLDPEELREVVHAYQSASAEVIERFDGHVAQYLGDGLLVYFGYPRAHEDDAERAVSSGLGIVRAIAALNERAQQRGGPTLSLRIGIHTGLTVVGEIGSGARRERLALGQTPNVAARVESLAEPDTVMITEATHRLVLGAFRCAAVGRHELRGVSEPIEVFRVLGERSAHDRLEVTRGRGSTPFTGREVVLDELLAAWDRAREGAPQVVVLGGEAGIGKSRVAETLAARLGAIPHRRKELHSSPFYRNSAFYPLVEALRAELALTAQIPGGEKLDRIEGLLAEAGLPADGESVPLWASLLSVPLEGRYPELRMSAPQRKAATLRAVVEWLVRLAAREPLLLMVHDLHWVDPSTLELLDLLVALDRPAKILLLLSHRPEFEPPWPESLTLRRLTLEKLEPVQVASMIRSLAGGQRLPLELVDQLISRTDGVPLFVEELTKTVLESDLLRAGPSGYDLAEPLPSFDIPSTLQSSLLARLDRLTSAKEVAQLGAVVGREIPRELLARLSPLGDEALDRELDRLVEADLLGRRQGAVGEVLVFRHALIQEAAYKSLLRADRQVQHARIGEMLEETYGAEDGPRAELLAHHFTLGARPAEAVRFWHEAGRKALERSANVEAARHIRAGLELMAALDDPGERARRELELQTVLGSALMAVKGYAASEVVEVFGRARELADQVGDNRQQIGVLMGLVRLHGARADLVRARAYGGELLDLAGRSGAEEFVLEAHRFLGAISFHMGSLESARQHLTEALALFDPVKHGDHAYLYNEDTEVFCLDNLAWALWHLGYPGEALERNRAALRRARELDHPFTLAHALSFRAVLLQFHRAAEAALAAAEEVIFTSEHHGFPHRLAMGQFVKGWARAELGNPAEGIALMDEGLDRWRASGAEILRPRFLTYMAETFLGDGQTELALELLEKAEVLGGVTGERFHEADLYRIRGEALWELSGEAAWDEVQSSLAAALEVARSQGAKLLELRTATRWARLLAGAGRQEGGVAPLAAVLDDFGAGFDGADFREARSLMEELSPAGGKGAAT